MIQPPQEQPNALQTVDTTAAMKFAELAEMTLWSVAKTSARVYGQTLKAWCAWCDLNGLDPLDLRPAVVLEFISEGDTTAATRKRQLSALRKLAQMAYVLNPTDDTRRFYEALRIRPTTHGRRQRQDAGAPSADARPSRQGTASMGR
ncbi:MAG: hypothetical protein IPK17_32415 [Chloroflexi bacterium]|uniref:site-specific integrase n=1 Tax=Candidatus Flexifilum breve TaxID=3140694 RepID=UPI003134B36D|nr:hypothetical protein [Chloroflexota bacterium]